MRTIKATIKQIPILGSLVQKIYQLLVGKNVYSSSLWIAQYIPNSPLNIVQIGANDGVSGDPLYQLAQQHEAWQLLLVEPVPPIFEQLKQNYGSDPRFKYENAAINEDGSKLDFYTVGQRAFDEIPTLSEEYHQIGSFNPEHIKKLSEGVLNDYITAIEVNCITLEQLFRKHAIHKLAAFLIDAEGYDWKILSQLDLSRFQPIIIVFEFLNLSEKERKAAISFLREDYHIFRFRIDFCCIRKDKMRAKDLKALRKVLVS